MGTMIFKLSYIPEEFQYYFNLCPHFLSMPLNIVDFEDEEWPSVVYWVQQNCQGIVWNRLAHQPGLRFELESDLLAFKLAWLL